MTLPVSFDLQPTLNGKLLTLRPLRADDRRELYAVASDPLIWEQHPIKERYQEEVFDAFFREAMESGGALVALDAADGRVIGSSRFHGHEEADSQIEIGWTFLARSHWGGAVNGEMKRLMIAHAFKYVANVVFLVGEGNMRSRKALAKIGAVCVGAKTDRGREHLVYRITRSEL